MTEKKEKNKLENINFHRICEHYAQVFEEKGSFPTIRDTAKALKLNKSTVLEHLQAWKKMSLSEKVEEHKVLTSNMVGAAYKTGISGNVAAMKLFLSMVENWSETQKVEHSGNLDHGYDLKSMSIEELKALKEKLNE